MAILATMPAVAAAYVRRFITANIGKLSVIVGFDQADVVDYPYQQLVDRKEFFITVTLENCSYNSTTSVEVSLRVTAHGHPLYCGHSDISEVLAKILDLMEDDVNGAQARSYAIGSLQGTSLSRISPTGEMTYETPEEDDYTIASMLVRVWGSGA